MLVLSDQKFKVVVFDRPTDLMEKVKNIQEHMGKVSKQMGSLKKNRKEIQEIKTL